MDIQLDEKVLAKQNADKCSSEIEETLKKYGLLIKPIIISSQEGIVPTIVLIKREEEANGSSDKPEPIVA